MSVFPCWCEVLPLGFQSRIHCDSTASADGFSGVFHREYWQIKRMQNAMQLTFGSTCHSVLLDGTGQLLTAFVSYLLDIHLGFPWESVFKMPGKGASPFV
jgi:hypothetical protein